MDTPPDGEDDASTLGLPDLVAGFVLGAFVVGVDFLAGVDFLDVDVFLAGVDLLTGVVFLVGDVTGAGSGSGVVAGLPDIRAAYASTSGDPFPPFTVPAMG
jgi:hypothetical protein